VQRDGSRGDVLGSGGRLSRKIAGPEALAAALDAGEPIARILILEGAGASGPSPASHTVAERAKSLGVPVCEESAREMRRMSEGPGAEEILGLCGPRPPGDLHSLMDTTGLVVLLSGVRYPTNAGFVIRCAEVAGAAGVVIDADWTEASRAEASRVSIRAERFLSVLYAPSEDSIAAARRGGRRIVAVETVGDESPWSVDLREPTLVVLGSETRGIPDHLLSEADAIVRIPTRGFIPSYNVQAASGMLIGEWLRQTTS
jgi:tRNA G18 (ribose-2'-O)-methylase SpoU